MFLGIDFGTTGARACAVATDKSIQWEHALAYQDANRQSASDWRDALYVLLDAMPKSISSELRGIAIDGTSGTVLLCDAQLEPISPTLFYNDPRAKSEASRLRDCASANNMVSTATSGLTKFFWLTERYPNARYFLHQADWLTALLSGQAGISDYHNALKTGYDVGSLCWPEWLMAMPHTQLLPRVIAPGTVISAIKPDIASRYSISESCLIHAGTTDSNAAFMASDVHETGIGVTALGTTLVLKQLSERRIDAPEYGIYSHKYGDLWLVGGASNAGAGVLREYFDDAQLLSLSAQIDPDIDSRLDYYPLSKAGERFPINDANLQPRLTPRPADNAAFLHGLLQGLASIEAAGYAKLAQLGAPPLQRVLSNGGGAKNLVWQLMRARILGVPVATSTHTQASYGSALMALGNDENT